MILATGLIFKDEKAFWLSEGWRGERRIQILHVLRGDKIAVHEEDLGLQSECKADKFQIPSFWEYSVAELQDIADFLRDGKPMSNPEEQRDLASLWLEELDEKRAQMAHRSVYGPALAIARS